MSKLVAFLSAATGLTERDVLGIIMRAPTSYKHYTIDKRSGGKRSIAQPAREVKALQRVLARRLSDLQIHRAAMAYRPGMSIRHNAARHAGNGPILKFDFEDFFLSIRAEDWRTYCVSKGIFSIASDIELSARLFFHKSPGKQMLRMAIGAPSSPWLSNVLMYEIDKIITSSIEDKVIYTRYADDITFSAPRTGFLTGVEKTLRLIVNEATTPRLKINDAKTVTATNKFRRVVTGLVLADDGRVTIGRERKRLIRSMVHRALTIGVSAEDAAKTVGLLAFARDIEPDFLQKIIDQYGKDVLIKLSTQSS